MEEAREILGTDHFARQRFFTDGRGVFLAVKESAKADEGEAMMKLLSGGQWVIPDVIKALADEIEFDSSTDLAQRWYPPDADRRVVVDPAVSFGSPSVAGTGITTANVYDLYVAEGRKIGPVRRWFGLETDCIEAAICFEERMAA
ncbi:DUF433 domain-containing protein [Candidatus Poribacteria bacterium]|nr:DUF433 domain-containing protein [Candidatus Poribacteria bacterium]